jgi:hypothetical protein
MTDHYLKFPDQATMLEALRPLGMTYTPELPSEPEVDPETGRKKISMAPIYPQLDTANEQVSQGGHQYAAHEVGLIDGVEGWHYNLRVVDPEFDVSSLEQYQVFPRNPRCVFA